MENKNFKSESYIVREAENIIDDYIERRELLSSNQYYKIQEKYERIKMLFVSFIVAGMIFFAINCILK